MLKQVCYICFLLLVLVVIYAPINILNFAKYDDEWMLLDYPLIHPPVFNMEYLKHVLFSFNSLQYSPLNTIFYYLIYQINGYDAYWFHLACFIIHLANAGLIYLLSKKIFAHFNIEPQESLAYICCFLWAIHPFNVESVVWISASKIPLFTFFSLISFLSFIKFIDQKKSVHFVISILMFIFSCLVKEQAVVLPLIFAWYLICSSSYKNIFSKKNIFILLPFFIIALFFGIVTIIALKSAIGMASPISKYSFYQRIIFAFYSLCFYCFNFFLPFDLHYHYRYPIKPDQNFHWVYYLFPPVVLWLLTVIYQKLSQSFYPKFYLFCAGLFFLNLGLCLHIVPLSRPAIMADRYMYLPTLALLLMIIPTLNSAYNTLDLNGYKKSFKTGGALVLTLAIISFLALYSRHLVENWQHLNIK